MATSPTQRLANVALGTDVGAWVTARRNTPAKPSFQTIADELKAATGGQVSVTDQTIRLWYVAELKAKHGACPNCTVPTWHNGDSCPEENAVAS